MTVFFLRRVTVGRGPPVEHIVFRQNIVNGALREKGDVIVIHLPCELSVADFGVQFSVFDDSRNFGRQYLAVIDRGARFRRQQLAGLVEPSVVGAVFYTVKPQQVVKVEVRAAELQFDVFNNEGAICRRY